MAINTSIQIGPMNYLKAASRSLPSKPFSADLREDVLPPNILPEYDKSEAPSDLIMKFFGFDQQDAQQVVQRCELRSCLKVASTIPSEEFISPKSRVRFNLPDDFKDKNSLKKYRSQAQFIKRTNDALKDFKKTMPSDTPKIAQARAPRGRGRGRGRGRREEDQPARRVGRQSNQYKTETATVVIPTKDGLKTKTLLLRAQSKESKCPFASIPKASSSKSAQANTKKPISLSSKRSSQPDKVENSETKEVSTYFGNSSLSQPRIYVKSNPHLIHATEVVTMSLDVEQTCPVVAHTLTKTEVKNKPIKETVKPKEDKADLEVAKPIEVSASTNNKDISRTKTSNQSNLPMSACRKKLKNKSHNTEKLILGCQPKMEYLPSTLLASLQDAEEIEIQKQHKRELKKQFNNALKRKSLKSTSQHTLEPYAVALCEAREVNITKHREDLLTLTCTTAKKWQKNANTSKKIKSNLSSLEELTLSTISYIEGVTESDTESIKGRSLIQKQLIGCLESIDTLFLRSNEVAIQITDYLKKDIKQKQYLITCYGRMLYCLCSADAILPRLQSTSMRTIKKSLASRWITANSSTKLELKSQITDTILLNMNTVSFPPTIDPCTFSSTLFSTDPANSQLIYSQMLLPSITLTESIPSKVFLNKIQYWLARFNITVHAREFTNVSSISESLLNCLDQLAPSEFAATKISSLLHMQLTFFSFVDQTYKTVRASFDSNGFDELELTQIELLHNFEKAEDSNQRHKKLIELTVTASSKEKAEAKTKMLDIFLKLVGDVRQLNLNLDTHYTEYVNEQHKQFAAKISICQEVALKLLAEEDSQHQLCHLLPVEPASVIIEELHGDDSDCNSDCDSVQSDIFYDCLVTMEKKESDQDKITNIGTALSAEPKRTKVQLARKSYEILINELKKDCHANLKRFEIITIAIDCDLIVLKSTISNLSRNHSVVLNYHRALTTSFEKAKSYNSEFKESVKNLNKIFSLLDGKMLSLINLLSQLQQTISNENETADYLKCIEYLWDDITTLLDHLSTLNQIKTDVSNSYHERGVQIRRHFEGNLRPLQQTDKMGIDLKSNISTLIDTNNKFNQYIERLDIIAKQIKSHFIPMSS